MSHFIYIVRCSDNTLYTGYTVGIQERVREHNEGSQGAKYTRARRPVSLVYKEQYKTRSEALKREAEIKKLTRAQKLLLIQNG